MKTKLPDSWHSIIAEELDKPYFKTLGAYVDDERAKFPGKIYPPEDEVFSAFDLTPFENVSVLILGQDPYVQQGQAHGLCFSVRSGIKIPPSLVNIYKELHTDVGAPIPKHGFLESWAKQGVLMLNTVLTVREGERNSHAKRGWEPFTDAVIRQVNAKESPVVFVLWGEPALKKKSLIDTKKHVIVEGAHPSPLSASRGFFGTKPFSAINRALEKAGRPVIDWQIAAL